MSLTKSTRQNADDAGRLSDDEASSAGHTSSDDDEDDDNDDGHPMMSIFASYYGIKDPGASAVDNTPKGTIDDAGFQAEQYVKVSSSLLRHPCLHSTTIGTSPYSYALQIIYL